MTNEEYGNQRYLNESMTRREYFAGLAMQGILAGGKQQWDKSKTNDVHHAIAYADELISQLNQQKEPNDN